jgi:hypothetical protein
MFRPVLTVAMVIAGLCLAATTAPPSPSTPPRARPGPPLTSGGVGVRFEAAAGPDTFRVYGGPNNPAEGKFQDVGERPVFWGTRGTPSGRGDGTAWTSRTNLP